MSLFFLSRIFVQLICCLCNLYHLRNDFTFIVFRIKEILFFAWQIFLVLSIFFLLVYLSPCFFRKTFLWFRVELSSVFERQVIHNTVVIGYEDYEFSNCHSKIHQSRGRTHKHAHRERDWQYLRSLFLLIHSNHLQFRCCLWKRFE